ncbi:MAG: type II toxin-antitoxin system HicA family toxin [Alkalinema sp. CAN_BIN05]|nr:type II toxin-antitoxin system HicA family toxin [Alkalinema sp. CAN_BIN05]
MKAVSGKMLCKIVEYQGWELKRITGSHHIYSKEGVDAIISIPDHKNRDLPTGTLRSIMKDAELMEKDLDL